MRTLLSDNVLCVDVDDTLISWEEANEDSPHESCVPIEIVFNDISAIYWVFRDNVQSIKTHHHKGHHIVVWSGSGHEWAETVVRALNLIDYVDIVMAKPRWLLDDLKPSEFLPIPYWGKGDPGKAKLK